MADDTPWGPSGKVVYDRTYSRTKADGSRETWPETVHRVVFGNLELVYGSDRSTWTDDVFAEAHDLEQLMRDFAVIPAGRHLWASGVTGFLFNCWVSGWYEKFSDHFQFASNRLFEGGGVGTNYSSKYIQGYGAPKREVELHVIADPSHPDFSEMEPMLSAAYEPQLGWDYTGNEPDGYHYAGEGVPVEDTREGWADALTTLIDFCYGEASGDVLVFDVGGIRKSGAKLKSSGGTASGPAPLVTMLRKTAAILNAAHAAGAVTPLDAMCIDHAIAEAVVAGGTRRSARMSIVRWDDPYIFDFISCKSDTGDHWTTNISIEIDDEFLRNLSLGDGGTAQRVYQAKAVHAAACKAMLENGEPGYWNSSLSNAGETGEVTSTNPCGEIALEASEPCNLGHVNMDYFANRPWSELEEAHRLMTRFLIRATFGDVRDSVSRSVLNANRRIGVGHLGVQGYWAKRGVKYSEIPLTAPSELDELYTVVRAEARSYAFELRIPEPVKVTCVAPTGSISKLPGVTEGIGALYAKWFEQRIRFSMRDEDQWQTAMRAEFEGFTVEDDVYDASGMTKVVVYPTENTLVKQVRELGFREDIVQSADELSLEQMLSVQRCYQEHWADNAVSYTCNIPEGSVTPDELQDVLARFLPGLKGTTIMVDATREQAPYTRITQSEYEAATAKRISDSTDENCASGACPVR